MHKIIFNWEEPSEITFSDLESDIPNDDLKYNRSMIAADRMCELGG